MKSKYLVFSVLVFLISACSDTLLLKGLNKGVNIQSAGDFCTQSPDQSKLYTKFLFIIDKSGSNVQSPGTDPNNVYRADNIEKFYNAHANNEFIKWGYIAFQSSGANAYIGTDANPIFSDVPADMQNALAKQRSNPDFNGTPYKAALSMAKMAIRTDIQTHPDEQSHYMVFFMSDGMPTDYDNVEKPAGPAAFADVEDLINLLPGQINFSTAYYGPASNTAAADGLEKMAQYGKGKFVNLNVTGEIDLDDLITGGISSESYEIKPGSFMVFNVNTAICFDNTIGLDSDSDGLCDVDEKKLGTPFDPQNRFSFGDGYSDYFHYFALKAHDTLMPCADRTDEDNDLLTACEESYMKNNTPAGTKKVTGDPKNPDTDGDGILDGIEFFMLHDKSVALNETSILLNYDTETTNSGDQIRQHRNPLFPDANLPKSKIYDTKLEPTGKNAQNQSCYHFSQNYLETFATLPVNNNQVLNSNFSHGANGNVVLVYYIETLQREPKSPGIYAYSFQTLDSTPANAAKGTNGGLIINDKVFKLYKVPVTP